jgi:hypothetical protein
MLMPERLTTPMTREPDRINARKIMLNLYNTHVMVHQQYSDLSNYYDPDRTWQLHRLSGPQLFCRPRRRFSYWRSRVT